MAPVDSGQSPETILPPWCIVAAAFWEVKSQVKEAQLTDPGAGNGPPNHLYVPAPLRSQVLVWGHASKLTCHPGIQRTLEFIRRRFWWPCMAQDIQSFVVACSICAREKASHQPSSVLLRPLPIPSRPWSHIAVDFVTGPPLSAGNMTILNIVDRFSKGLHFVPLSKLPSALETADLLTQHVFRLHGLPLDIVSDRGPQFTSQVWKAFCRSACPLVTTPKLTGRPSKQTRTWKQLSVASQPNIPHPGVLTWPGSSTPSTPSLAPPQIWLRSR